MDAAGAASGQSARSLVVEPDLQDDEVVAVHQVDEAVFFGDPPRPRAGEHMAKRFGFTYARGWVAEGVVD